MVGVTKIQRGNAGYWLAAVAEGGDDYYTKPGEAPGEWIGDLAADLALAGEVDAASYSQILEGTDPISGSQLLKRPDTRYRQRPDGTEKRIEPVLGYDVRFSAPKSVSILYALGDEATRERVVAILNDAVREGVAHLEQNACYVQRGEGGKELERGTGFVGMAFRHRMSRAGDPALHTHVVVSNMTRAAKDGKWLSIASPPARSPLWLHAKPAGVVFQASLRAGLVREFGVDFTDVKNGYADVAGIPRAAIDALSTRSREIAEWLEQHGAEGAAAAEVAAYKTRDAKDFDVAEDERRGEWITTAEPHGVSPETVGELVASGNPREPRRATEADLDAALTRLEETKSHFDRRTLLGAIADQLPEGADREELDAAVDAVLGSDRIVCLHWNEDPLIFDTYTTPKVNTMENRLIDAAQAGTAAEAGKADEAVVARVLDRHAYLGEDQRAMAVRLTTGGERVVAVAARPGTGKTTALEAARQVWEEAGFDVVGCATANTASAELRDAGIAKATSIRKLLSNAESRRARGLAPLRRGAVIVVDEASMASTPDLDELRMLALECDGKLVLIGDDKQIGAIGPGGTFATLVRRLDAVRLTTIRRQHRPEDRRLVALLHEGRGSEALDLLRTESRIIVGDTLPDTLAAMVIDWHRDYAAGDDVAMIARRNRDVDFLNDCARELRRESGALGETEISVGGRAFAVGDRVQTRINREGVFNRERWDVIAVHPGDGSVELRRVGGDGRLVWVGADYLDRRRLGDNGPALEHAYALTKYGAQGKTLDRAYPLLDGESSLEQELVALSRGREVAYVYAVASSELTDEDLGPGRRELSDELHDVRAAIERTGNEYAAEEVAARRLINSYEGWELAEKRAELRAEADQFNPALDRRDRLDEETARAEEAVARLSRERAALEATAAPPAGEVERLSAAEEREAAELHRIVAERDALPGPDPDAPAREPSKRLRAALIERRIEQLVSRRIEADRLEVSELTFATLGAFPADDPDRSLAWHEGARALYTYRYRHGIEGDGPDPLGAQPRGAAARADRARAQRRVAQSQRRLGRTAARSAQREHRRERSASR